MKIFNYENVEFVVGENQDDNYNILDKYTRENPDFIWFHLNSFPSGYVIMLETLDNLDKNHSQNLLNYGANLCKMQTKYKNLKDIYIIYTRLRKLKKTDCVGEVLVTGKCSRIKL